MEPQSCPNCLRQAAKWLSDPSEGTWANYYRCDTCGHVWTIRKDTNEVRHVTPLGEQTKEPDVPEL